MEINKTEAEVILGAIAVSWDEGISGIHSGKVDMNVYDKAEEELNKKIRDEYPDLDKKYYNQFITPDEVK